MANRPRGRPTLPVYVSFSDEEPDGSSGKMSGRGSLQEGVFLALLDAMERHTEVVKYELRQIREILAVQLGYDADTEITDTDREEANEIS